MERKNSIEDLNRAANLILNSEKVYIAGMGISRIVADYLYDSKIPYVGISDNEEISMMQMTDYRLFASGKAVVFHNFISNAICLVELLLVQISYKKKGELESFLTELEETRKKLSEYM